MKGGKNVSDSKEIAEMLSAISIVSQNLAEQIPRNETLKMIYVASPLRGDVQRNINQAANYCRFVVSKGFIPIAPHIYFTRFLNDEIEKEREIGMLLGKEILRKCNELWVFMQNGKTSSGMREEVTEAQKLGIAIRYFNDGKMKGEHDEERSN